MSETNVKKATGVAPAAVKPETIDQLLSGINPADLASPEVFRQLKKAITSPHGAPSSGSITSTVAVEVARTAIAQGLARAPIDDLVEAVRSAQWWPVYCPVEAV